MSFYKAVLSDSPTTNPSVTCIEINMVKSLLSPQVCVPHRRFRSVVVYQSQLASRSHVKPWKQWLRLVFLCHIKAERKFKTEICRCGLGCSLCSLSIPSPTSGSRMAAVTPAIRLTFQLSIKSEGQQKGTTPPSRFFQKLHTPLLFISH